jgi:hypothetical protein
VSAVQLAAVLGAVVLLASMVSVEAGITVALLELTLGVAAGNLFHLSRGWRSGTISSLYGLNAGIIDKTQFSLLVTVVVLSAVVPTAIAERWFLPSAERELRIDRRLAYAESEEYV